MIYEMSKIIYLLAWLVEAYTVSIFFKFDILIYGGMTKLNLLIFVNVLWVVQTLRVKEISTLYL